MRRTLALLVVAFLSACSGESAEPLGDAPAKRVVTFAPHLAEIVFAVGAGDLLVGVSAWSDYPDAVRQIPRVGDAFSVDQEALSLLHPDLVLAWESGMPAHTVDELRGRGYRVETIRTRSLADVAAAMRRIGALTGRDEPGDRAAMDFDLSLDALRESHRDAAPIGVFFQVSARPLYTINSDHFISEIITICGGRNIFGDLEGFAPSVDIEAVIARDPEVMLAGANVGDDAYVEWSRWPGLAANRYDNKFLLPDETIGRPSPRLAQAAHAVCAVLDRARANRDALS